jgi:hypothetical protein
MIIKSAKNPRWSNPGHSTINLTIEVEGIETELPFTADPNDVEAHGRQLFQNAIAGTFGPIAEYVEPIVPTPTAEQNKQRASDLLVATDWTMQPDVIDDSIHPHLINYSEFKSYRAVLRGIAINPKPGHIDWPSKPVARWS